MIEGLTKKRILFIVQLPPPVHGASVMNSIAVNSELIKKNFSVEVINLEFSQSVHQVARFSVAKVIKGIFYGFVILKKILIKYPDLVYFTVSLTGFALYRDAYYVLLLKMFNKDIVYHLHGKGIKNNIKGNFFKKCLYSWIFKNSHIICLSERLAEDINEVYKSTPYVVPNGIITYANLDLTKKKCRKAIPKVLFLSNYIRTKGVMVLIEALYILKIQGLEFSAELVGAPSDLTVEFLESVISTKGLSRYVKVIGPLYNEEKYIVFQESDIFVLPTYYDNEAFPLVILEAMQFGLPVVSTYEGGIPDIVINNETGFLVENKNSEILAEKIAILLTDKDLRIRMGEKGHERFINNFTLDHFEQKLNTIFHSIFGIV
jgi:glycosyltransferase involved in cell wall biosynthesis